MAGLIKLAMEGNYPAGNQWVMTCHCGTNGVATPTDVDVDAALTVLRDWWEVGTSGEASLRSFLSGACTLQRITGQKIRPLPEAPVREHLGPFTAGSNVNSGTAPQLAVVLSLRTALAGRSRRGRMYVCGITEQTMDTGGELDAVVAQGYADSADGMRRSMENVGAGEFELEVFSRKLNVWTPVTQIRVGTRVDTQRRRKIRETTYKVGA